MLKACVTPLAAAVLLLSVVVFAFSGASAAILQEYSGQLSTNTPSGLNTGGTFWTRNTMISWVVDNSSPDFATWHYSYTFSVLNTPGDSIQFLDLEASTTLVSPSLPGLNWMGTTRIGVMDSGSACPGMPQGLTGIQLAPAPGDGNAYTTWTFSFDSTRGPVWGDFYARGSQSNWVSNKGFTSPDTDPSLALYPLQNGSVYSHLLVPALGDSNVAIGRSGSIQVVTFRDVGGAGAAYSDPNFRLPDWAVAVDGNNVHLSGTTGTDGSSLFAPLNGQFPWKVSEVEQDGLHFTKAWVYDDANGALVGTFTDPNSVFADISSDNMTVYFGNIPEPASLLLAGAGCAVLAIRTRRRRPRR